MLTKKLFPTLILLASLLNVAWGQEIIAPLSSLPLLPSPKSADTLTVEIPFFDDFSDYEGSPSVDRWLTNQAFVNKDYAPLPPTVGMATLDAIDGNGNIYAHATTNIFGADTLASQIIRLDSITGSNQRKLQPSDSISLSFYYLPGGWYGNPWELVGDAPSSSDSLFLEFFDANQNAWNVVWCSPGFTVDTAGLRSHWPWKYAYVKIDSSKYFNKKFQFRFRNYASLDPNPKAGIAGNCDQWNIDYVFIGTNRTVADSFFRDVAFVEKAPSMLRQYYAMPARQFSQSEMATNIELIIVNRYNQTLASNYSYSVYSSDGQLIKNYDGGFENVPPFFPNGNYQSNTLHSKPPVNFSFAVNSSPSEFYITHVVREGVSGDNRSGNDTITFRQVFADYYAYDDGVPENGYGLTAPGNKVWLSCRYDLSTPDTLTAVDLYFNRTRNDENAHIQFQLCIWRCSNGMPSTLLYKDSEKSTPVFDGMNRMHRYKLSTPVLVSDTIFVGFEQLSNDFINLGFDRSNDSRRYTYYRTSGEWMQSILRGAVMMRPVFGSKAVVDIAQTPIEELDCSFFPNPASDKIHIRSNNPSPLMRISLSDMHGRTLLDDTLSETIDLSPIPNGIYILRIYNTSTAQQTIKKLIIRK